MSDGSRAFELLLSVTRDGPLTLGAQIEDSSGARSARGR
jgi:hypothetical protein